MGDRLPPCCRKDPRSAWRPRAQPRPCCPCRSPPPPSPHLPSPLLSLLPSLATVHCRARRSPPVMPTIVRAWHTHPPAGPLGLSRTHSVPLTGALRLGPRAIACRAPPEPPPRPVSGPAPTLRALRRSSPRSPWRPAQRSLRVSLLMPSSAQAWPTPPCWTTGHSNHDLLGRSTTLSSVTSNPVDVDVHSNHEPRSALPCRAVRSYRPHGR